MAVARNGADQSRAEGFQMSVRSRGDSRLQGAPVAG